MENGKTIKQIADELGVSKQSVHKKIDKLGLRSSLRKIVNQFVVDDNQEKRIKSSFLEEKSSTKSSTKSSIVNQVDDKKNTQNNVIEVEQTYQDLFVMYMEAKDAINEQEKRIFNLECIANFKQDKIDSLEKELEYCRKELEKERNFSREQGEKFTEKFAVLADQSQQLQLAQMKSPVLAIEENTTAKKKWQFWK